MISNQVKKTPKKSLDEGEEADTRYLPGDLDCYLGQGP